MAAADTARLVASLTLDAKGFTSGLSKAEKGLGKLESTSFRVGQNIGSGLKTAGSNLLKLGTIGTIGAVGLLAKSVQNASDLNEQLNKTQAVFGKFGKQVVTFSQTTADALGITQAEALEAAGNFGNMFKTIGLADKQSAEFSQSLVTLAADMASFNNEDPSEMLDKLRSGLSGEAEPLRRFGVLLSEAAVQQEAYATGIAKTGDKLTEAQKVQARYSLILKQTKVQQGDFAKTSDSLANVMRRLKANLTDAGATIGTALLPKVTELAIKFNKLIKDNQPAIVAFANTLPGAFDKALAFAEKIPWQTIGDGIEKAAFFAGKLFDVFLAMPPEVQTTLIALAGLNKLTGGAVTGVVSELGKGLIKGVLGMNAGVVNINAATVNTGGTPGTGGTQSGGVAGALKPGLALASGVVILGVAQSAAADLTTAIAGPKAGQIQRDLGGGPVNIAGPIDRLLRAFQGDFRSGAEVAANTDKIIGKFDPLTAKIGGLSQDERETKRSADKVAEAVHNATAQERDIATRNQQAAFAIRDKVAQVPLPITTAINSAKAVAQQTTAAARAAGQQTAAAIRDKDLSVDVRSVVNVSTSVSVKSTIGATQKVNKYTTIL